MAPAPLYAARPKTGLRFILSHYEGLTPRRYDYVARFPGFLEAYAPPKSYHVPASLTLSPGTGRYIRSEVVEPPRLRGERNPSFP